MPKPMTDRRTPWIRVANPCPMRWEDLNPVAGGRHCDACRKTVIDVERLSAAELEALVDSGERACVRVATLPDGSVLTRDHPQKQRRTAAWAGAALAASTFACAEGVVGDEREACRESAAREAPSSAGAEFEERPVRPTSETEPSVLIGRSEVVMVVGAMESVHRGGVEAPPESPVLDLTDGVSSRGAMEMETSVTLGGIGAYGVIGDEFLGIDIDGQLETLRRSVFEESSTNED